MSIRTTAEFEDIMQPIIVSALGWTGDDIENVRIGWPIDGAPGWGIDENIIFITATPVDHLINRQHDVLIENSSPDLVATHSLTRVMVVNFVAYGPEATLNLEKIHLAMFYDSVRFSLKDEEIYFVPDNPSARRLPERFQARWWNRADMQLRFNEKLTDEENINAIDSVDVSIDQENDSLTEFTVN
jgi:hypothetical protein